MDEKNIWTEAGIRALKPTGERVQFVDPETGMVMLMTPRGAKTFYTVYRAGGGRTGPKRWLKHGRFDRGLSLTEARKLHRKAVGEIAHGRDPHLERRTHRGARVKVSELCRRFDAEYLAKGEVAESTAVGYRQHIKAHILPALGNDIVAEVGPSRVALFLGGIEAKGQRNKVRSTLSRLFSRAELWEMRPPGTNPVASQDRSESSPREVRATNEQLAAIGAAIAKSKSWKLRAAVVILACSGMRVSELAGNTGKKIPPRPWADVDLEAGVIRLPYHKTVRKRGEKTIYLPHQAVAFMRDLPRENDLVLGGWKRPQHAWRELCEANGIHGLNLHDLRHTFSSIGDDMGYSEATRQALLGHSAKTQTGQYTHKLSKDLQESASAIGGRIWTLLGL